MPISLEDVLDCPLEGFVICPTFVLDCSFNDSSKSLVRFLSISFEHQRVQKIPVENFLDLSSA